MTMSRIEEVFVPDTITTVDGLVGFLAQLILDRGGDPATVQCLNTREAIPNIQHSDEWPCLTFAFDPASETP